MKTDIKSFAHLSGYESIYLKECVSIPLEKGHPYGYREKQLLTFAIRENYEYSIFPSIIRYSGETYHFLGEANLDSPVIEITAHFISDELDQLKEFLKLEKGKILYPAALYESQIKITFADQSCLIIYTEG